MSTVAEIITDNNKTFFGCNLSLSTDGMTMFNKNISVSAS